jgi:hypothetical protein
VLLCWRLGRREIVRPRRQWLGLLGGPSASPLGATSAALRGRLLERLSRLVARPDDAAASDCWRFQWGCGWVFHRLHMPADRRPASGSAYSCTELGDSGRLLCSDSRGYLSEGRHVCLPAIRAAPGAVR